MEDLLYLVHRIPYPPNKGDKIRSYHLLRHLAKHYRVHLGTFVDDEDDWQHVGKLQELCASVHCAKLNPKLARVRSLGALFADRSLSVDFYRDAGMRDWVDRTAKQHGIRRVIVFSSPMAQYALQVPDARRVIDFVDVDSDKWRQYADKKRWPMSWLYGHEARQLLAFETDVARRFDSSLFVSAAEAALFRTLVPADVAAKVDYFSNGVDTDYFAPSDRIAKPHPDGVRSIVFTGAMDYWPNVDAVQWFADEVFPAVLRAHPAAQFTIVGARPSAQVQALASRPGIVVTGTVPDVRPYVMHADVAVAPLRIARGIQNKVLEAMAMARPVVVSPQALEGIHAEPGADLLLAPDAQTFAGAVNDLLASPDPALGERARRTVIERYGWTSNLSRIDALLEPDLQAAL